MIELTVFAYLIAHGALWFVLIGFVVYVVYLFLFGKRGDSSSPSQSSSNSNTFNNKAPVKRHYEGYIEHGDTIPVKLFGVRDKKNRPNTYDCYGERWDDNTGHVHQLFTYEKPLTDFEPKHIETDSISMEYYNNHIGTLMVQYGNFISEEPNTLNDYKLEKYLPIKVDSSVKQDKGWMATFAMVLIDCEGDTTFMPAYDLIVNNKIYLHSKYKTEIACMAYEVFKEYYISVVNNDTDELTNNLISALLFYFEHSDEDYYDFLRRNNFDSKYIDFSKNMNCKLSELFNSDADLILKHWNDSNIQKDDVYLCSLDYFISSEMDMEVRSYIIVREVPLTH